MDYLRFCEMFFLCIGMILSLGIYFWADSVERRHGNKWRSLF